MTLDADVYEKALAVATSLENFLLPEHCGKYFRLFDNSTGPIQEPRALVFGTACRRTFLCSFSRMLS